MAEPALHLASEQDIDGDPGARAMWAYVMSHDPPRPGDEVLCGRFFMDRDAYQRPSPSFNVLTIAAMQLWLSHPQLAWELIGPWGDLATAEPMMRYIGYHHATEATYEVGGRRYHVFANDWRRRPIEDWLDMMGEQELGAEPAPPPPVPVLALSQPEFADAVRRALRDLHRPDALAANPLQRARMTGAAPLDELLEQAVDVAARRPARRQAGARAGAHLPAPGADPGGGRRGARPAVQHLPPPPHPRRRARGRLALAPRAVRAGSEHKPTW